MILVRSPPFAAGFINLVSSGPLHRPICCSFLACAHTVIVIISPTCYLLYYCSLPHLSKLRLDQCLTTYYYLDSLTPLPISPLGTKLNCSMPPFILRSDAGHRARDPPPRAHFLWLWATKSNYNRRFFTTRCVHCILIWDIHVPLHRYFITPNLGLPSIRTLRSVFLTMVNGFHVFVVSCG